ncbi:MAG: M81 family metallopeptidase [Verrucomicrobiota bacterium]|nr:M81 family metallopeptidase [Verrucomicrobiota bacterium]
MSLRIGIGGIFIECNHFTDQLTDSSAFKRSEWLSGAELLSKDTGVVGGMLSLLNANEFESVPLLYTSACPGGVLQSDTYSSLKDELLQLLNESGKLDGVLLCLHGAGAAVNAPDLEGDLARAVRSQIGDRVPIVATLDLHAHITAELVSETDALLAWETYPHVDAFKTGERGAQAIIDILTGCLKPFMAMAKVPLVVSAIQGQTKPPGPFADIMDEAKRLEGNGNLYSINPILVHPYLNLVDMGGGVLVVANESQSEAVDVAKSLAKSYWDNRHELQPQALQPRDAIRQGLNIDGGPILLVETADCCGGGAAGDSVHCLKALLAEASDQAAIVPVVDPDAAQLAHKVGIGQNIQLQLGHQIDQKWGEPVFLDGVVVRLSDGEFNYRGGIWDGRVGCMGLTAVVEVDSIQIVVSSNATYDWMTEQFDLVGLDIVNSKFIVVKNPMNYQQAYEGIMKAAFVLDTPGPTPANTNVLEYSKFKNDWFPSKADLEIDEPIVLISKRRDLAKI